MKRSRKVGFILEAIAVFVLMAVLSSIAVPEIEQMIHKDQDSLRADEFNAVKDAVVEMLADSQVKTLQSIGPVQDLSKVQTSDSPPLYLEDYLDISKIESDGLDCQYTFTADGEVIQQCP